MPSQSLWILNFGMDLLDARFLSPISWPYVSYSLAYVPFQSNSPPDSSQTQVGRELTSNIAPTMARWYATAQP